MITRKSEVTAEIEEGRGGVQILNFLPVHNSFLNKTLRTDILVSYKPLSSKNIYYQHD